ncbi:MAG: hypothetical protein JXB13_17790 [Phycisphaerae bacterium]|nr:hypothetical protein [Phycisphaerae bacterium]
MRRACRVRACASAVALGLLIVIGGAFCNAQSGGSGRPATSNQTDDNDNNANDNGTVDNGGEDLTAPETLGGTVNVKDLTIPAGHTTRVTSDLVVNASGNVVIEGALVADASDLVGISIAVDAQGDIDINGIVQASDAGDGSAVSSGAGTLSIAQADDELTVPPLAGKCGGEIELASGRQLTVRNNAILQTGSGSNGQDGLEENWGGCGGNLDLRAGTTLSLRGSLIIGNGGNGGQVDTTIDHLPASGLFTNHGGRGGVALFFAPTLDIPGLRTVRDDIYALDTNEYASSTGSMIFGGGGGGAGGVLVTDFMVGSSAGAGAAQLAGAQADPSEDEPVDDDDDTEVDYTLCKCPPGHRCLIAAEGGWGWQYGGPGGTILIAVTYDRNGIDGTSWAGIAGTGGDVDEKLILNTPGIKAVILDDAQAGWGGMANVSVPWGADGDGSHGNGGNGGSAFACGGRGGDGSLYGEQIGGNGGQALAAGGTGGWGYLDACNPGDGGNGGDATARGGDAGDGFTPGVPGGAEAGGGFGGAGGEGSPETGVGAGGSGGKLSACDGCEGASGPDVTSLHCGDYDESYASDGDPGSAAGCCGCSQ